MMRRTMYATAGLGYGVDISHYGAPYKGMLGLGSYFGEYVNQPLGMMYATAGLGAAWPAGTDWTPGPGQAPSDDPRMVRQYATISGTFTPRGITQDQSAHAADLLVAEAQRQFPGNTVRKIGTTGWTSNGMVGYTVILAQATRLGEIRRKNKLVGDTVGPTVGSGTSFYNDLTNWTPADIQIPTAPAAPSAITPGTVPPIPGAAPTPPPTENFLTQDVGGIPVWAVGLIGVAVLGGVGLMLMRPKPRAAAAPTPNRRQRRSRRRRAA